MPDTPCPPPPTYNGFASRVMLFGGLLIIFSSIALAAFVKGISNWVVIALAVIGGALVPNAKIIELVNAWRSRSGA